ncbi:MAG: amidohydrolase [Eubacteriales bacterium]|nr:amidohydrolase [Eubacteriales bacterium]
MKDSVIFKNITVVTPENDFVQVRYNCCVSVKEGKYRYIGDSYAEASALFKANEPEVYDGTGKILMPCFVNSHTHLAMTLLRNRADDRKLHDWLYGSVFPIEAKMRPEDLQAGTLLGIAEMIKSGSGACANMYVMHEDAMDTQLAVDTGIKLNTVISAGHLDEGSGSYVLDEGYFDHLYDKYNGASEGRVRCGLLVHSIYLYDKPYYGKLAEMAIRKGTYIHTHLSETRKEVEDCIRDFGMTPAEAMNAAGMFDVHTLAAHCVYLSRKDLGILSEKNVSVAHNPVSNLKLGSGMADIRSMIDASINVCIGTDGPASNNALDMVQDMRFAAYIAKGLAEDPTAVNACEIFRMATINGMKALGFDLSGAVSEGWKADLIIIDTGSEHMSPMADPVSAIVYSMKSTDVETLMIDGKMLMRKRELTTIDTEKVIYEAERSAEFLYNTVAK